MNESTRDERGRLPLQGGGCDKPLCFSWTAALCKRNTRSPGQLRVAAHAEPGTEELTHKVPSYQHRQCQFKMTLRKIYLVRVFKRLWVRQTTLKHRDPRCFRENPIHIVIWRISVLSYLFLVSSFLLHLLLHLLFQSSLSICRQCYLRMVLLGEANHKTPTSCDIRVLTVIYFTF